MSERPRCMLCGEYLDSSAVAESEMTCKICGTEFLWWAINYGRQYSSALIYVPLPQNVVAADEQLLMTLNFQGQPLLSQ